MVPTGRSSHMGWKLALLPLSHPPASSLVPTHPLLPSLPFSPPSPPSPKHIQDPHSHLLLRHGRKSAAGGGPPAPRWQGVARCTEMRAERLPGRHEQQQCGLPAWLGHSGRERGEPATAGNRHLQQPLHLPTLQYLIDPNAVVAPAPSPGGDGGSRGRTRGAARPSAAAAAAPMVLNKQQMENSIDRMFDGEGGWRGDHDTAAERARVAEPSPHQLGGFGKPAM